MFSFNLYLARQPSTQHQLNNQMPVPAHNTYRFNNLNLFPNVLGIVRVYLPSLFRHLALIATSPISTTTLCNLHFTLSTPLIKLFNNLNLLFSYLFSLHLYIIAAHFSINFI